MVVFALNPKGFVGPMYSIAEQSPSSRIVGVSRSHQDRRGDTRVSQMAIEAEPEAVGSDSRNPMPRTY